MSGPLRARDREPGDPRQSRPLPRRRRHHPLPPRRHRPRLGRDRRRRAPSSTTTRGSRRATTPGACATRWVRRCADIAPVVQPEGTSAYVLWFPVVLHPARRHHVRPAPLLPALRVRGLEPADVRGRDRARERAHASRSSTCSPTSASTTAPAGFLGGTITVHHARRERARLRPPARVRHRVPPRDRAVRRVRRPVSTAQWRGAEHVDGEHFPDCTAADALAQRSPASPGARARRGPTDRRRRATATCRASSPARTPTSASTEHGGPAQ